jgi:hypothetical protein
MDQAFMTNVSRSVEEQLAQLAVALQQKEYELVALRNRAANNTYVEVR